VGTVDDIKRILNKLDSITEDITGIKVVQAEQKVILEEHMRRSLANEQAVELLKEELKPLQKKEAMLDGVLKFLGVLSLIAALAAGIKDLFS
jgi:hypothetical protein